MDALVTEASIEVQVLPTFFGREQSAVDGHANIVARECARSSFRPWIQLFSGGVR